MEDQAKSTTGPDLIYILEETLADNDKKRNPALGHHIQLIHEDWTVLQAFLVVLIIMVLLTLIMMLCIAMTDRKMKDDPLLGETEDIPKRRNGKTLRNLSKNLHVAFKKIWSSLSQSLGQRDSVLDIEHQVLRLHCRVALYSH